MQCALLGPVDVSQSRSILTYSMFVLTGLTFIIVILTVAPMMIFTKLGACRRDSPCISLEKDLMASLKTEVHPCENFYDHVCSGWDRSQARVYSSPLIKYGKSFSGLVVKSLLLKKIPSNPQSSEDKASFLLLRCLSNNPSYSDSGVQLASYLRKLRLPWPHKIPTSRQQLMDIMLQASLDFGLPAIWAFYVGRHPRKPTENTLYLDLTARTVVFVENLYDLQKQDNLQRYLRRCAEVIGGTGQSYRGMIVDVITIHRMFISMVRQHGSELGELSYMNMSDAELRRAINGHLPDNSQLWEADTIVNLQTELFNVFDKTFMQTAAFREKLRLYLGAFIVWDLSSLGYRYLTTHMMSDMKNEEFEDEYVTWRCLDALKVIMPVVVWKVHSELIQDKLAVFQELKLVIEATKRYALRYGETVAAIVTDSARQIKVNAFNSSSTSAALDRMYDFFNITLSGPFFTTYLNACANVAAYFKNWLRLPQHNIVHLQGVSELRIYSLLTVRESIVYSYLQAPPLTLSDHPVQVKAAVIGTKLARDILLDQEYIYFRDSDFKMLNITELRSPELQRLLQGMEYVHSLMLTRTRTKFGHHSDNRMVTMQSLAAALALSAHSSSMTSANGRVARNTTSTFQGVPSDQLFFLVMCFMTCGEVHRPSRRAKALCNVALPAVDGFSKAFGCSSSQPLAFNFSWDTN